jgi:hypothetical protein
MKKWIDEVGGMRYQNAGILIGAGIDTDNRLPLEVFGYVGDQSILAHRHDHILWLEEITIQGFPIYSAAAPIGRYAPFNDAECFFLLEVDGFERI